MRGTIVEYFHMVVPPTFLVWSHTVLAPHFYDRLSLVRWRMVQFTLSQIGAQRFILIPIDLDSESGRFGWYCFPRGGTRRLGARPG